MIFFTGALIIVKMEFEKYKYFAIFFHRLKYLMDTLRQVFNSSPHFIYILSVDCLNCN